MGVPLTVMMHFAELKIIAYRKYVSKIFAKINNSGDGARGHWAKCAAKYLRLSLDLEYQARETGWFFLSMHGSFATYLMFNALLFWSRGAGPALLDALVMTCLLMVIWLLYLWADSRVTISATDSVTDVVLSYVRSIGDDSPKASTTGVNAFLVILEKHPTGCYLFPLCGSKQVLSRGIIVKILAAPLFNM